MVQVDIFWSYGLASGLTLAAGNKVRVAERPFSTGACAAIMLWIAALFAPSGMYLLWQFPSWETMFVAQTHASIPAWLVAVFAATNVTQGALGYYVTWWCLRRGKTRAALLQPVWSHAAMLFVLLFGWDGTGFRRFTYSGTAVEFASGISYPWTAFFQSPVFFTLIGMGAVLVPTYAWLCMRLRNDR